MSIALNLAMPVSDHTSSLRDEDFRTLHRFSTRLHVKPNETIFQNGCGASHYYMIISGTVRVCKHAPGGDRQIADLKYPGEFFGFIAGSEQGYWSEAVTDTILFSYPKVEIDRLARTNPDLHQRLSALLVGNLQSMQQNLLAQEHQTPTERVATFLSRHSERDSAVPGDLADLMMGRQDQDIADYLGLAVEAVCRAFSEIIRAGSAPQYAYH